MTDAEQEHLGFRCNRHIGIRYRARHWLVAWHKGCVFVRPKAGQVAPGVWCFYFLGFELSWWSAS